MADCFRAFGWNATVIDGTDMKEIDKTLAALPEVTLNGKPNAIICSTTKGQGVGFMMERPCACTSAASMMTSWPRPKRTSRNILRKNWRRCNNGWIYILLR